MQDFLVVMLKIAAMFLVLAVGWIARRRAYMTAETTGTLSLLVVDVIFPAMVFTQMLKTVTLENLRAEWFIPLMGGGIIVLAELVGLLVMPLFVRRQNRPTAVFLTAIPNWVYLPLPIVAVLFGDEGVCDIFLFNVGAQLALWTIGVWTLRGRWPDLTTFKYLLLNPGLIATAAGISLALLCPSWRLLETCNAGSTAPALLPLAAVIQALAMLGSLTIPLSLLVTGAQLGSLKLKDQRPVRELNGVVVTRLLIAPAVAIAFIWALGQAGVAIPEVPRLEGYLIACMPVAISCSIMAERFGGDSLLSARAIFYSTLWSIVTVPGFYYLIRSLGL